MVSQYVSTALERAEYRLLDDGSFAATVRGLKGVLVRVLSDGYFFNTVPELMVDPEYQRRGIGRELMRRALHASTGGRLFLGAQPGNEGFFERSGFERGPVGFVGRRDDLGSPSSSQAG